MNTVGVAAGVILGLVFVWSGSTKLRAGENWKVAGTPFSTSNRSIDRAIQFALPWFEIVLGAVLIAQIAPLGFGIVSALLLVVFSVAIVRIILRGEKTPCMCFGASSTSNVSWKHVARNAVLVTLAAATTFAA